MNFKHEINDTDTSRTVVATSPTTVEPQKLVNYALQFAPSYNVKKDVKAEGRHYINGDMLVQVTWLKED